MIIGKKTIGWPVPGMNFGGREVFIQANPGDDTCLLEKYAAYMCCANKMLADLLEAPATNHHRLEVLKDWLKRWESTGINMGHTVQTNINPRMIKEIDGG